MWTAYRNLKLWFGNWKHDLKELGFAKRDETRDLFISEEQLFCVVIIDEISISLDRSSGNRGGRLKV